MVLNELIARTLPRDVKGVDAFLAEFIAQRIKQNQELHGEESEKNQFTERHVSLFASNERFKYRSTILQ